METATKTVSQCLDESLQNMDDFNPDIPEIIGTASVGDVVRQGDLYLVCLSSMPSGDEIQDMKLAPGNSQGSRHILEGDVSIVKNWKWRSYPELKEQHDVLVGPAFKCHGEVEVTHPEHQNKILPEGTVWGTVYQRQLADEVRRVQD